MLRNVITTTATCLVLGIGAIAHAADKHGHDHKPLYGGILGEAAGLDFELVAKADILTLYVVAATPSYYSKRRISLAITSVRFFWGEPGSLRRSWPWRVSCMAPTVGITIIPFSIYRLSTHPQVIGAGQIAA